MIERQHKLYPEYFFQLHEQQTPHGQADISSNDWHVFIQFSPERNQLNRRIRFNCGLHNRNTTIDKRLILNFTLSLNYKCCKSCSEC